MGKKLRKITKWVKRHKDTIPAVGVAVGVVAAVVSLVFLGLQTGSLRKQTQVLSEQYQLLAEQYKATFRPSLGVENITTQDGNNSSIDILIDVKNYGQVPATKVDLAKVIIGGADVRYDEKTKTYTFTYTSNGTESPPKTTPTDNNTGVSITVSGGLLVALINENYPPDIIFFPGQDQVIIATVDKPTYQATVSETKVMYVALLYSSGLDQYYCVAKATLQDDTWKVIQNRGN